MATTRTTCGRCCGRLSLDHPCRSCVAAEDVARDMGIPVEEMLAVAREQWLLPDGSTRTLFVPEAAEAPEVEPAAALTGR